MGNYQSRTAQVLQDVWREEWERTYAEADRMLSDDMKSLTSANEEWPELFTACQKSVEVKELQRIIKEGADVNKRTEDGWTAVQVCAVTKGSKELLALLLSLGADASASTKFGHTPLHLAACAGLDGQLSILLQATGVNVNTRANHNITPLHVACAFGNERVCKCLIQAGAQLEAVDRNSFTPLHIAAHLGQTKVVEVLLSSGASVNAASQQSDTPLHLACFSDHREIVELLVTKFKANVNAVDKEKHTPLHYCCRKGYLALTNFLIENGGNPRAKNVYNDTPLHLTCYNGWVGVCQALVSAGVDFSLENVYSETPLHAACTSGATQTLIDFILSQPGVNVNRQGKDGHTPLHSACYHGHFHAVKVLLERGADFRIKDRAGAQPIKWAFERGFDNIVEYLRSCYPHDDKDMEPYETPSPLGKIRHVTKEKLDMLQLRGVLSELEGQISINDVDFYEVIGQGSFGSVYKGRYKNRTIAIKKLKPGVLKAKSDVEKFCREVKILCELDHPNVIGFIGACTKEPSQFCIVTEYARGGSLHSVLHKQKRMLDTPRKVDIALDVARGMHYLHTLAHPIIHRDLNPYNILLNDKGTALVADFGESRLLIKTLSGVEDMTKQSGNLRYMAPEVFIQSAVYTEKADVYSYGLCIWELFAEAIPFDELLSAAAAAEMAYNSSRPFVPPSWPKELTSLITRCWVADPSIRPTFEEIIGIIEKDLRSFTLPISPVIEGSEGLETVLPGRPGSLRLRSNSTRDSSSSDYIEVRKIRSPHHPHLRTPSIDRKPFSWNNGTGDDTSIESPLGSLTLS